ncbi:hypothetical protein WA026_006052 [Henosepilachna vigintioctopunctata]|uniref:Nose resistant to fluoxetine protein 6-like n=1 Tax=Henosepilachna vigintioctopunctata TaxID=420089 RepID=A0AAW1TS21_9CUCU
MGNFDECIQVHIPGDFGFSGQHCMAHFKLRPRLPSPVNNVFDPEYDQYEKIFNITTWQKITDFGRDLTKQYRDESYLTFCIPSSCSYKDLEDSLKLSIQEIQELLEIDVDVSVNRRDCQVQKEIDLTKMDVLFLTVVGICVLFGLLCTMYHIVSRSDEFKHLQLSGKKHNILRAFSHLHTMEKITSVCKSDGDLQCIHGLKTLSMFIVIMGHRVMFSVGSPLSNPNYIEGFYKKSHYYSLFCGDAVIDSFLTTSGFLATYLILCEINRRKQMINIFVIYFHRFIRLTPAYIVVLGFYCTIFIHLGEGPFWEQRIGVEQERCVASWWTNILYINNYVKLDQMCMFQSWYLACDSQYFFILPFLVYFLWKKPEFGLILCVTLTIFFSIIPIIVIYIKQENPGQLLYMRLLKDPVMNPAFQKTYIPSHMRASPYLVGIVAGYIKFKIQISGSKIPKIIAYFGWIISILFVCFTQFLAFLYYQPSEKKNFLFSGIYESMHHFLSSLFIAWVIFGVSEGCGKWIAPILNWKPWAILSRLTFTTYLCHGAIQLYSVAVMRYPMHASVFSMGYYMAADIVFAYIAGLFLSLCFESPIIELEKIFFRRNSASDEENKKETSKKDENVR